MEEQIVADLKQNIPVAPEFVAAPKAPASTDEPSSSAAPLPPIDELTLYKVSTFLGQSYSPVDKEVNERITFIYDTVSQSIGTNDYGLVTAKISELQRQIGVNSSHPGDNLFQLWMWLKLDHRKRSIEAEMGALNGSRG